MQNESQTEYLNRKEIFKFLNKATGKTIFVRGGTFLVTSRENDIQRGFDTSCFIEVSKAAAKKYVEDTLSTGFEARGAKIRITHGGEVAGIPSRCIFVG